MKSRIGLLVFLYVRLLLLFFILTPTFCMKVLCVEPQQRYKAAEQGSGGGWGADPQSDTPSSPPDTEGSDPNDGN